MDSGVQPRHISVDKKKSPPNKKDAQ